MQTEHIPYFLTFLNSNPVNRTPFPSLISTAFLSPIRRTGKREIIKLHQYPTIAQHCASEYELSMKSLRFQTEGESSWDKYSSQLMAYYVTHGHSNIPADSKDHKGLHQWCITQRTAWRKGLLSVERYRALSSIDFEWDPKYAKWKEKFYELVSFKQEHGHCMVSQITSDKKRLSLARWVAKQRHFFRRGILPDDRRRRLEGLGFSFSPNDDRFSIRLAQLKGWRETYGHCNIPRSWSHDPPLARWADTVRVRWRQGRLPTKHYRALSEMGFNFTPQESNWNENFQSLEAFVRDKGHCSPSFFEDPRLSAWISAQRRRRVSGNLSRFQEMQLYNLGVDWRSWRKISDEKIEQLRLYKEQTGTFNIPHHEKRLLQWINQIRACGSQKLSQSHRKKLQLLGFSIVEIE